jgi:CRISPR-associated protein Cas6
MQRPVADPVGDVVDVAFDVAGGSLPAENAWALAAAIGARLPWFAEEPLAGVHPLRAVPTAYGVVLLARRAKLVLRMPAARFSASLELQDAELDVAGSALRVGQGAARPLRSSPTLSANRVVTGAETAAQFESDVRRVLDALAVECALISGRRRQGSAGERTVAGFALSLAGLSPRDSLWIQRVGIGGERQLGWGVFVPAKAITPAE